MRRVLAMVLAPILALGLPCLAGPAAAAAFDDFDVPDGRISEPGGFGFNLSITGGRRGQLGEGAAKNGLLLTPELSYATTPWHEVELALPVAREFSGDTFGGGFKLRNTFVQPNAAERPFALGLAIELLHHQSARFSDADWVVSLKPIISLRSGPWHVVLNPAVDVPLGRDGAIFVPAVRVARQLGEGAWVGLEHYMDFGRIDQPEAPRDQAHQLFVVTDVRLTDQFGLHLGLGRGLTSASDRWAGKVMLSMDF